MRWLLAPWTFGQPLVLLSPTDPPGGGGPDDDDELDDPPAVPATVSGDAALAMRDYRDSVGSWLRKQRRAVANYRTRARTAEETLATERQERQKVRTLGEQEAADYDAFLALGKPADLTRRLADADTATQRLTTLERDAVIRDAATAAGYKFSVLRDRAADLPIEVREVDQDGKKVSRAFVKPQGGGEHELTAYAQQHWGDYLPALAAQGNGGTTGQGQQQGQGLSFPRQQGGGGTGPRSLVDDFIAQRNEAAGKAPNPLAPAAAAR